MKNRKSIIAILACLVMVFSVSFCMTGCGSSAAPDKYLMDYPEGIDTTEGGGSSYDGWCDDPETSYFAINDYYNMESEGTLHILTNFSPYQQTTEYSCAAASAVEVINWFDSDLAKKYDEHTIIDMSGTSEEEGANVQNIQGFFDEIGWYTQGHFSVDEYFSWDNSDDPLLDFENFCIENIDNGVPVMVNWSDWGGHWMTIIGIDTCQDDNSSDDVLIFADPYDTSDHYQDGYYTYSAERFFYQWREGSASALSDRAEQPFLVAMPMEKAKELGLAK